MRGVIPRRSGGDPGRDADGGEEGGVFDVGGGLVVPSRLAGFQLSACFCLGEGEEVGGKGVSRGKQNDKVWIPR